MAKKHKNKNYPQPVQTKESLGNILKSAREKLNFSIDDIHKKTRITVKNISLMEEENWDLLPAPVYLKGFIKLYAREVGLNYDEIIKLYEPPVQNEVALNKHTTLSPAVATLSSFFDDSKGSNKNESESRVSSALVVFILLILATLAISYFASHKENDTSSSPSASEMTNFDVTG